MTYKAKYTMPRNTTKADTWAVQMSNEASTETVTLNCDLIMNEQKFIELTEKLAKFLHENDITYKINIKGLTY
jgi:hypothetical protein